MAAKLCTVAELVEALTQLDPSMPVAVSGHYDNDQHQFYDFSLTTTPVVFDQSGTPASEYLGDPLNPGESVVQMLYVEADYHTAQSVID